MAMGLLGYGYGYDCGAMAMAVESLTKDGVEVGNGYKDTVEVESFGDGEGLQFTDIRYNQFSDRK